MANTVPPPTSNGHILDSTARLKKPIHTERFVKMICVGAGPAGLILAYKLQRSFQNFELTVYEKNDKIAGTWYENNYPGCGSETTSQTYTWSFEPKQDFTGVYGNASEIFDYFQNFSKKYDLQKYCKLSHKVSNAKWDEDAGRWDIVVKDLVTENVIQDSCHILINAGGIFNRWMWPDIPGLHSYQGKLMHTARWDAEVDLKGKHVGIIGNGPSAIQLLPAICPLVDKITNFVRKAAWVSPVRVFPPRDYTKEECELFKNDQGALIEHRKKLENVTNHMFDVFVEGSETQRVVHERMRILMKETLRDPFLEEKLIPEWHIGYRRLVPGDNYLETLRSEKVEVVFGEIERITEAGCITDGQEYPVDILICATGFDISFIPQFALIGPEGKDLADEWAVEPKGYLSLAAPKYPNFFMFGGPNGPYGNGTFLPTMELVTNYILKFVNRWQTENIHSFSPKMEAVEDFIAHKDEFMKKVSWGQDCPSFYKAATGKVKVMWPGSALHFMEAIAEPRYDDWEIKYSGNRFAFFGNGFSQIESDPEGDMAYYIRNEDNGPYIGRRKQRKLEGWPFL